MQLKINLFIIACLISGCSGYMQETKRYQLPSSEGQVKFEEKVKGQKKELYSAALAWINEYFNQETLKLVKQDIDQGLIILTALAPVKGRTEQEYCRYQMRLIVNDELAKIHFKTLRLTDQFYPSQNNINELKQYYNQIKNDFKKALEQAVKKK